MFLFGIGSLLQLILLPGYLAVRIAKIKTASPIQTFLFSLGLSQYVNYLAVCVLTWLHLYTRSVVFTLFDLELILILYWHRHDAARIFAAPTVAALHHRFRAFVSSLPPLHTNAFRAACLVVVFFVCLVPVSAGTSYYFSDALMHWTRWPDAWASNAFPVATGHYPQLFPANLSLLNIFIGEPELRFFAKVFMPVFSIGILLMFVDLYLHRRSLVVLAGTFIYAAYLLVFYSILFVLDVNADLPVAFFAFLTWYAVVRRAEGSDLRTTVVLVMVFAVSAANTKLAGVYILPPAGLWIARYFYMNWTSARREDLARTFAVVAAIGAAGFFWYALQPAEMIGGLNQSVFLSPFYAVRVERAAAMLYYTAGAPFLVFIMATLAAAVFTREGKWLVTVMVIPSTLLWAFFFSADYRNLSYVIPFAAMASAHGVSLLYHMVIKESGRAMTTLPPESAASRFITALKVGLPVLIILAAGTDAFFNFCMSVAYGLNALFFRSFRLVLTTELGYYRSVEYYCSGLRLVSAFVLAFMAAKYFRVRSSFVLIAAIAVCVVAGTVLLPAERLQQQQADDEKMTAIRNLYYRVRPYRQPDHPSLIITNSEPFARLVPPPGMTFLYRNDPGAPAVLTQLTAQRDDAAVFLLIDKTALANALPETPAPAVPRAGEKECFDDGEFQLVRVEARSTQRDGAADSTRTRAR